MCFLIGVPGGCSLCSCYCAVLSSNLFPWVCGKRQSRVWIIWIILWILELYTQNETHSYSLYLRDLRTSAMDWCSAFFLCIWKKKPEHFRQNVTYWHQISRSFLAFLFSEIWISFYKGLTCDRNLKNRGEPVWSKIFFFFVINHCIFGKILRM